MEERGEEKGERERERERESRSHRVNSRFAHGDDKLRPPSVRPSVRTRGSDVKRKRERERERTRDRRVSMWDTGSHSRDADGE